jgi:hypothetical protein
MLHFGKHFRKKFLHTEPVLGDAGCHPSQIHPGCDLEGSLTKVSAGPCGPHHPFHQAQPLAAVRDGANIAPGLQTLFQTPTSTASPPGCSALNSRPCAHIALMSATSTTGTGSPALPIKASTSLILFTPHLHPSISSWGGGALYPLSTVGAYQPSARAANTALASGSLPRPRVPQTYPPPRRPARATSRSRACPSPEFPRTSNSPPACGESSR